MTFGEKDRYNIPMPYYDEVFKHITGEFPHGLAALALNTPDVEVGDRLGTDQATVLHHISQLDEFFEKVIHAKTIEDIQY